MVWACAAVVGAVVCGIRCMGNAMLAAKHERDKPKMSKAVLVSIVYGNGALALAFLAGWLARGHQ